MPKGPGRQWVLALPHRVRFLCAYDPVTCAGVRRIFVRAVASFSKRVARNQGVDDPRVGCVAFAQRFDSALRLNHFHTLWPDGAFTCSSAVDDRATFHPAPKITDDDIDKLARAIRQRVLRYLRRHGADAEGFSLHAGVCIPGYARERLELLESFPGVLGNAAARVQGETVAFGAELLPDA